MMSTVWRGLGLGLALAGLAASTGARAISISATATAGFGAITPPKDSPTTAADIVVTVIIDTTTGYTLAAHRDTDTYMQGISLMKGAGAVPSGTTFRTTPFNFATTFIPLTNAAVIFASRTSGASPLAGDPFPVSLQLPTFAWQAAANSATIGVITFTAIAT